MVLPGHLAGGYLFTKAFLVLSPVTFSTPETTAILVIGTILGEAPDIDLFRFYFANKKGRRTTFPHHRFYITHNPFFWFGIGIIIASFGLFMSSNFLTALGLLFWICPWSHFLFDSIDVGIRWLWPFSNKFYALLKTSQKEDIDGQKGTFSYYWKIITRHYVKSLTFYAEMIVVIIALWVFYYKSLLQP